MATETSGPRSFGEHRNYRCGGIAAVKTITMLRVAISTKASICPRS